MAQFKAICNVNIDNKIVERNVYINDAKNDADAEKQAKSYMILEQSELDFINVKQVLKL